MNKINTNSIHGIPIHKRQTNSMKGLFQSVNFINKINKKNKNNNNENNLQHSYMLTTSNLNINFNNLGNNDLKKNNDSKKNKGLNNSFDDFSENSSSRNNNNNLILNEEIKFKIKNIKNKI